MGVVWRARQVSLNRGGGLKMILAGGVASAGDGERVPQGARGPAPMGPPPILPLLQGGEDGRHPFLHHQLIEGGSLADLLGRSGWTLQNKEDGRRTARLMAAVARAVHYAHQRGILHRDLKPANILLASAPASGGREPPESASSGDSRPPLAE